MKPFSIGNRLQRENYFQVTTYKSTGYTIRESVVTLQKPLLASPSQYMSREGDGKNGHLMQMTFIYRDAAHDLFKHRGAELMDGGR